MYAEWASLRNEIQRSGDHESVLTRSFPSTVGKDVAGSVVHYLAFMVNKSNDENEPSTLGTDSAVKWTMQALCHGLTLPMTDYETIKECVSIYCEWLSCLTSPKKCVPIPILEDPNAYSQDILKHLYNIFVPRLDQDQLSRQAMLCHRVLKTVQHSATTSSIITDQTWDCLLRFLLAINDVLLSPPAEKESIGSQLCERVLSVLFEIWIVACCRCFPSPSLWKTLKEMCSGWRHHEALVMQWHRVNVAFTSRLLKVIYGNSVQGLQLSEDEEKLIPEEISNECVIQCWFRFLHILGNPVELSRRSVIANTPKFLHMALTSEVPIEPEEHECLKNLPTIFYRAMKSVAVVTDAFLGITHRDTVDADWLMSSLSSKQGDLSAATNTSTPPSHRRPKPSFLLPHVSKVVKDSGPRPSLSETWTGPTFATFSSGTGGAQSSDNNLFSPCRPTVNSLLHLLGSWLLEASLVGVRVYGSSARALRSRTASLHMDSDPARLQSQLDHSLTDDASGSFDAGYEMGRAQACGALCRIFCSHKTGESIIPIYTSRFYISLYYGLQVFSDMKTIPVVLASIISNASDLFRLDLDGIDVLLPQILAALEELQPRFRYKHDNVDEDVELRHSSIHLLLSAICLPLQFGNLSIRAILDDQQSDPKVTFISLKKRLADLLQKMLTSETDSVNTQMLLGCLVVCVQDQALHEEANGELNEITDSVQDLFGLASSLVCNRLMASWKTELSCALAAMEVLSAFARIKMRRPNTLNCKRVINWICEFVKFQCSRPAPAHSKDLHSMIVMAFRCLTTWLMEHDYLLQDKDCLHTVLQVVELGISGSMSQQRASDIPRFKGDKELKPVSLRVRDAAEVLLATIIDYVGSFPPPCGPESLCTLLSEESLVKQCGKKMDDSSLPDAGLPFQYFVLDGSTIIGLLEQPLGNNSESLPTVTAIVRGAFGRHAWMMQLRHHPRSFQRDPKSSSVNHVISSFEPKIPPRIQHQYFPDIVQQIPPVLADYSIPRLESTMSEYQQELNKLQNIVSAQVQFEQTCIQNHAKQQKPIPRCTEPSSCQEFQTARLFLTHYGFLTLDGLKTGSMSGMMPSLVRLNNSDPNLWHDLKQLDCLSVRTADTVHIFYVKTGQTKLTDILQNVTRKCNVQDQFLEFLRSLGWPVDVQNHSGWTGSIATSWKSKANHDEESTYSSDTGGSLYDGGQQVLYWSDVSTEVAFVVPSPSTYLASLENEKSQMQTTNASASSLDSSAMMKAKSLSLDLESVPADTGPPVRPKRTTRSGTSSVTSDMHVMVVWLESYEDHLCFPFVDAQKVCQNSKANVVPSTSSQKQIHPNQTCLIFVHPLHNGLFRIHLQAQQSRASEAVPLVDGMVVSRRLLGHLVRLTAVNIFRRRQLDSEQYQPPHVRRKVKIKDIVERYQVKLTESEFYASLFLDTDANTQPLK